MVGCVLREDWMWPDSIAATPKFCGHLFFFFFPQCLWIASVASHVLLLQLLVQLFFSPPSLKRSFVKFSDSLLLESSLGPPLLQLWLPGCLAHWRAFAFSSQDKWESRRWQWAKSPAGKEAKMILVIRFQEHPLNCSPLLETSHPEL